MARPGTQINIVDDAPAGGAVLDTSQAFFVGVADMGPVGTPLRLTSLSAYKRAYGERAGGSLLYNAVYAYFREGGGTLWVSRVGAQDMVTAEADIGTSLAATAKSPGVWGNDLDIVVLDPDPTVVGQQGTGYLLEVQLNGEAVERTSLLADNDAAAAWSQRSDYVELEKLAATLPTAGTTSLTGGAAGAALAGPDWERALAAFDYQLGPGQVVAPGMTSSGVQTAVLAHVDSTRRCALLDLPDTDDALELEAAVQALRGLPGCRFASAWAPWAVYPAETPPATIVVPFSAIEAASIAKVDAFGNPNEPAAGANGESVNAVGLTQAYTDAEREALNVEGVDIALLKYGRVRAYGYRTAAGPDDVAWLWFSNSRVVMGISAECDAVAEEYVLRQVDGRRHLLAKLEADLRGICKRYYDLDALFGETEEDAFAVDTSEALNPVEQLAAGEVHAVVRVKTSPAAEWVVIDIVKVPPERAI